ncbi:MAG: L,D-transpeptidase family protein [Planctomycetes bacterium]|nr:L,D-transpeptidase family protein [Planctomycetota bacterium]
MARQRYRPYRSRRQKSRNTRFFLLALLVILVGVVFLIRTAKKDGSDPLADESGMSLFDPVEVDAGQYEPPVAEFIEPEPAKPKFIKPKPVAAKPVTKAADEEIKAKPAKADASQTQTERTEPATDDAVVSDAGDTRADAPAADIEVGDSTSMVAAGLIREALVDIDVGRLISARDKLNDTLAKQLSADVRIGVKKQLEALSRKWLFSKQPYPGDILTGTYKVQPGDRLSDIGYQFKVPHEILMKINNISDARQLQAGQVLKVANGPFHVVIHRPTFTLDVYLQNTYIKSYRVGLGMGGKETPTGRWRVKKGGKLIKPTWTDKETGRTYDGDDPDYPLGSRWIAIEGLDDNIKNKSGFAIHGTKDPESIGTLSSRGCIRLFNGNAIELYDMLVPDYSEVVVRD